MLLRLVRWWILMVLMVRWWLCCIDKDCMSVVLIVLDCLPPQGYDDEDGDVIVTVVLMLTGFLSSSGLCSGWWGWCLKWWWWWCCNNDCSANSAGFFTSAGLCGGWRGSHASPLGSGLSADYQWDHTALSQMQSPHREKRYCLSPLALRSSWPGNAFRLKTHTSIHENALTHKLSRLGTWQYQKSKSLYQYQSNWLMMILHFEINMIWDYTYTQTHCLLPSPNCDVCFVYLCRRVYAHGVSAGSV